MPADQYPRADQSRDTDGTRAAADDANAADAADVADLSDRELMARHVRGDGGAAFGELFRRHRDRMYAVALRTTANRELAADAVQEAFISAFRRAEAYRGEAAVTTWLHRIVVNACLDRLRREKVSVRRAGDLGELDLPDPRDHHAAAEARLDVHAALATLPEGQRLALVLVDMQGLSVAEAAEALGVAEGTVKSRCFRGREALAQHLGARSGSRFTKLASETEPQGSP